MPGIFKFNWMLEIFTTRMIVEDYLPNCTCTTNEWHRNLIFRSEYVVILKQCKILFFIPFVVQYPYRFHHIMSVCVRYLLYRTSDNREMSKWYVLNCTVLLQENENKPALKLNVFQRLSNRSSLNFIFYDSSLTLTLHIFCIQWDFTELS